LTALAVAVVFAAITAHPGSAAADCKPSVTGHGSAQNNNALAKSRAKDNWRDVANAAYGNKYKHWVKSNGKNLYCGRSGGLGHRTWTCDAVSNPCR
jgi:hypothetical protein